MSEIFSRLSDHMLPIILGFIIVKMPSVQLSTTRCLTNAEDTSLRSTCYIEKINIQISVTFYCFKKKKDFAKIPGWSQLGHLWIIGLFDQD